MSQAAQKLCRRHNLTYVETADLRLVRRRCGNGFSYIDENGRTQRDKALKARIRSLAIPPAWTDVRIAEDSTAHIQAVGRDAEGRLQYRYHPYWEQARAESKAGRLLRLGSALPRLRSAVTRALAAPKLTRNNVTAAVVRLIDRALLRPGHEEYAQSSGSRGAATLLKSDVKVEGDKITLEFEGKGGKQIRREIRDRLLARVAKRLSMLRGRRFFVAPDEEGRVRPITARDVNAFLADTTGVDVTAKDFRTFRASAQALGLLVGNEGHEAEKPRKQAIIRAAEQVSKILGNTRNVARSSYIHPSLIQAYERGKLDAAVFRGKVRDGLNRIETALIRFLERNT
jgi:DNA topoisomerase I